MTDVSTPAPGTRALVLGGGGIAGIAWELGVLTALQDAGVEKIGRASCRERVSDTV